MPLVILPTPLAVPAVTSLPAVAALLPMDSAPFMGCRGNNVHGTFADAFRGCSCAFGGTNPNVAGTAANILGGAGAFVLLGVAVIRGLALVCALLSPAEHSESESEANDGLESAHSDPFS